SGGRLQSDRGGVCGLMIVGQSSFRHLLARRRRPRMRLSWARCVRSAPRAAGGAVWMIAGGNPEGAELDQPMTRRERRERERAAEAAAQARSDGTPDGEGGSAAQRPVIRPASRAPERADSGPAPHPDTAWHAGSPHTAPMPTAETQAYPAANAAGGWSTSQGQASLRGPAAAQSAFAASAADRGTYGGPAAAGHRRGGGAARSAGGTAAGGAGPTSRKRETAEPPAAARRR